MRTLRPTAIPPTALAVAVAAVKAAASSSAAAAAGTQEEEGGYQTQGLRSSCAHTLDAQHLGPNIASWPRSSTATASYTCYACVCISLCICLDYSATHIPPTGGRHMGGRAEGARRVDAHARTHAHTHAGLWALNSLGREWKDCEDELECGARSWGGGVGERGVGGGWGASGLAWPSPGRGLRRPGSEVRPPPPRARSL